MLASRTHNLTFAHYPKTAGTSLQRWFLDTCPDAKLLIPDNPHYPVRPSLVLLKPPRLERRLGQLMYRSMKLVSPTHDEQYRPLPGFLRIVGVIRNPFDMLVSLFEFWQREPAVAGSEDAFIGCTQHHMFRDFLAAAVIGGRIPSYEEFFDVGGPLWHNMSLLDFESLQPSLQTFCDANGLGHSRPFPAAPVAEPPGGRPRHPAVCGRGRDADGGRPQSIPLVL